MPRNTLRSYEPITASPELLELMAAGLPDDVPVRPGRILLEAVETLTHEQSELAFFEEGFHIRVGEN